MFRLLEYNVDALLHESISRCQVLYLASSRLFGGIAIYANSFPERNSRSGLRPATVDPVRCHRRIVRAMVKG